MSFWTSRIQGAILRSQKEATLMTDQPGSSYQQREDSKKISKYHVHKNKANVIQKNLTWKTMQFQTFCHEKPFWDGTHWLISSVFAFLVTAYVCHPGQVLLNGCEQFSPVSKFQRPDFRCVWVYQWRCASIFTKIWHNNPRTLNDEKSFPSQKLTSTSRDMWHHFYL